MRKLKTIIVFSIIFFGVLFFAKASLAAVIFQSGWERNPEAGCTAPAGTVDLHIVDRATAGDNTGFDYDHSIDPCNHEGWIYPSVFTVTSPVHSGIHSLAYHCPKNADPGVYVNGRGGVIPKTFSTTYPELYIRYYVRWDSNFRFVNYDYKSTFGMMTTGQHTYNSYYGGGGDGTTGALRFFWWGGSAVAPHSTNITLRLDTWQCVEWHLKYGPAGVGYAEAKVDGTLAQWETGGTKVYIVSADSPYLGNFSGFHLDNTINGYYNGTFQNAIPADAFIYYDDLVINSGDGWIGCGGVPDTTPPTPPTGVVVI